MGALWSLKYLQDHLTAKTVHFDITNNCTLERILFQVLVGAPFSVHAFSLSTQKNIAAA